MRAGTTLGKKLRPGDTVCLVGELGAGKTTFTKGIAAALGLAEKDIISASFTIIAQYDSHPPFYHIDLYRLDRPEDVEAAGVYDCIGGDGITVIEWAEKLPGKDREGLINVSFRFVSETEREILIEGLDEKDRDSNQKRQPRGH
ncbi:MAG: tRNA (adenosine(37)-N6)-threonylcarbamoyltransferase complex ATPase subunit type 1 TsaE [Nitrospirota bacterium]|jgi:tRNA threonylcarbamoyladenosine biosynthesis protein TsaE